MSEINYVLQGQAICKGYQDAGKEVSVLDNLEFSLQQGEQVAIIGSSGSGKSTLLNLLGGLDAPTSGSVMVDGSDLYAESELHRCEIRNRTLGFVYQFHHLLPEFSALENAAMPLLLRNESVKQATEQAKQILTEVGLAERLEHKPAQLSGGERQRVAIARALVGQPRCVLMDEPTGNLDRSTAADIQQLIQTLNEEKGIAFVLVTHDPELAATTGRVLELRDGQLHAHAG